MTPSITAGNIEIYEWPHPMAEIEDRERCELVVISTLEEACAVLDSMQRLVKAFEGNGQ